jgi:hypothetical protein
MLNSKRYLRICVLLIWVSSLMLQYKPTEATGLKLQLEETTAFANDNREDELTFRRSTPSNQTSVAYSIVPSDRAIEPSNWSISTIHQFLEVTPLLSVRKSLHSAHVADTCTVSSTNDSGANTLRQCLLDSIAGDMILFDSSTFPPGSSAVITLSSQLPDIQVDNLTIDASDAGVIIDGSALPGTPIGIKIVGVNGVIIRGLQIMNFYVGIQLMSGATNNTLGGDRSIGAGPLGQGNLISANIAGVVLQNAGTANNSILGNFIGTDLSGNNANGNGFAGIIIANGASENVIGGAHSPGVCDGPCNLISGNYEGVQIQDAGSDGNEILGNFIGTDLSGDNSNGNDYAGVLLGYGASQNVIGGSHNPGVCDGPCNLISGNLQVGVGIVSNATNNNQVLGNFIGADRSGDTANGNGFAGIVIGSGASQNVVGGSHSSGICDGPCNLISGNPTGLQIQNAGTVGNQVLGNFIGTRISGNTSVSNAYGIVIGFGAGQNLIGGARNPGACDGFCNLISGNEEIGVYILHAGTNGNQILGNFVGTNFSGDAGLPNNNGIEISQSASNNLIGSAVSGQGNLISGNITHGVFIIDDGTDGNQVLGNLIGTNINGNGVLPNYYGISIGLGASDTQVGGAATNAGNLVSGNTMFGVWIDSAETTGNQVLGNRIGTNISGNVALPNYTGILISTGSTGNQIGDAISGGGNLISGNEYYGVYMQYLNAPGNTITGNKIGTNLNGTAALPNYYGIHTFDASSNLIGGVEPNAGNLISGNANIGLSIDHGTLNIVQGNAIGTNLAGDAAVPNAYIGILVGNSTNNTIGGESAGAGNLISGNDDLGILVSGEVSVDNQILGNRIGTNRSGTSSLPNSGNGIVIILAQGTIIGGADILSPWVCDGPCNLISGNGGIGVSIQGVNPTTLGQMKSDGTNSTPADQANQVLGNFIGTDLAGTSALPNYNGVTLWIEASSNTIGGNNLIGEGNLISGNLYNGITVGDPLTANNQISGNRIGTTSNGEAALANGNNGVWIHAGASGNIVGGDGMGLGNLISGQSTDLLDFGVSISTEIEPKSVDNQVIGNMIGTNATGTSAIPNGGGVGIAYLVTGTIIRDNLISGNDLRGILLLETTENEIMDNKIGVASNGLSPLPNSEVGIVISTAPGNTIGVGNIIAYHQVGVAIFNPESIGNTITQNSIYANTDEQIGFFEVPEPLAPAPVLIGWDGATLSGTSCAGCQVEVFANADPQPAGRTYLGTATAAGDGTFSLIIVPHNRYLAATATDAGGTTSEFSNNLTISVGYYIYLPVVIKSDY